jgi:TolB-like protein
MSFFRELKQRKVIRVAITYVIVGWLTLQVSDILVPALRLPEWFHSAVVFFLIIGFPIALILSWAFELTPDGLKADKGTARTRPADRFAGRRLDFVVIGVLIVALGYFVYDEFDLSLNRSSAPDQPVAGGIPSLSALQTAGEKSVAVLQFENHSDEEDKLQYMVDGFREELVISLHQVPDLKFTRGRAWPREMSAQTIASELGVDAIVTGSLRSDGDRVRITAELVSADGFHIWADSFDGRAEDVFELQETVATQVRDAILGKKGERIRAASRPGNPEAYDTYMRGLFFLGKRDLTSLQRAEDLLQEAIRKDPNFGPAYLRLSMTYLLLSEHVPTERRHIFQKAIEVADTGIEADPSIRVPMQLVYGFIDHHYGNWTAAADAFAAALGGITVYPTTYQWHSRLLGVLGQLEASLAQAIIARAMEPASQVLNSRVAISYYWLDDMVNARHYFEEANSMGDGPPIHNFAYTLFLVRENRLEEARASAKQSLAMLQADDWWVDSVFDGLARPSDQDALDSAFATVETLVNERLAPPYITMTIWTLFGEMDRAMEIAMQVARSESSLLYEIDIIYLEEFREFRRHEQFPELLSALGLVDYWRSIGCAWRNDSLDCEAA